METKASEILVGCRVRVVDPGVGGLFNTRPVGSCGTVERVNEQAGSAVVRFDDMADTDYMIGLFRLERVEERSESVAGVAQGLECPAMVERARTCPVVSGMLAGIRAGREPGPLVVEAVLELSGAREVLLEQVTSVRAGLSVLKEQVRYLEAVVARFRAVIEALGRGDCFCEAGIDNPMAGGRHSAACEAARAALVAQAPGASPRPASRFPVLEEIAAELEARVAARSGEIIGKTGPENNSGNCLE